MLQLSILSLISIAVVVAAMLLHIILQQQLWGYGKEGRRTYARVSRSMDLEGLEGVHDIRNPSFHFRYACQAVGSIDFSCMIVCFDTRHQHSLMKA